MDRAFNNNINIQDWRLQLIIKGIIGSIISVVLYFFFYQMALQIYDFIITLTTCLLNIKKNVCLFAYCNLITINLEKIG